MCGIVGALVLDEAAAWPAERLRHAVAQMANAIAHRGPDDAGVWIHERGTLALGHRRLSIVDLSARGHQPMSYGDRFVVVFNGELYNFRELRAELCALGYTFQSETDTEVLMAAVQQWGIEPALQRFVGMFAFALWDRQQNTLCLARDRLGEKPLFVRLADGYLAFGSELRALEHFGDDPLKLSETAVSRYLLTGYVPCPSSMWEGIFKLPAASFLTLRAGRGVRIDPLHADHSLKFSEQGALRYYWSLDAVDRARFGAHGGQSDAELLDQLQSLLESAVDMQLRCDVPVGVFLSGGIDSTVVASAAQARSREPVSTFTVRFAAPGFDESEHAAAVARHLKTQHHEIDLDPQQLISDIPAMAAAMDEPTANASYFPLHAMATQARRHVKVILTGDGGDELFGGYNRYRLTPALWRRIGWLPALFRASLASLLLRASALQLSLPLLRPGLSGQVSGAVATKKFARALMAKSLGESYTKVMQCWDAIDKISTIEAVPRLDLECTYEDFLDRATRFDLRSYLPDDNLAKADRATMAAGIEGRIPLLDHRIVEFAFGLPDRLKLRDGTSKWLLRQLAYRSVPRELLDRPKMGFTVPVKEWLQGPLKAWAGDLLHSRLPYEKGFLRKEATLAAWDALQARNAPIAWEMWSIVIYCAWLHARGSAALVGGEG